MFIQNLDHCVPNPGILPVVLPAIVKIIAAKLTDQNERPVNGFRVSLCGNTLSLRSNFLRPDVYLQPFRLQTRARTGRSRNAGRCE
jgi:hypothetical protein